MNITSYLIKVANKEKNPMLIKKEQKIIILNLKYFCNIDVVCDNISFLINKLLL